MSKPFNYSFFSAHILKGIPIRIDNPYLSTHGAFWSNVGDFTMDVDEEHLEYCIVLILVGACLLEYLQVKKFPLPLNPENIRRIKRVENPSERLEMLSWLSDTDKPKFLADAHRVLNSLHD
jgi:hypothetical protein